MFDTLQDRLVDLFKSLRFKGRLSQAGINATMREIRIALLEADINLNAVKQFVSAVKECCAGTEISHALDPSQQTIKIVNEELISVLGGQVRTVRLVKKPPTVIMLTGLQGAGKTTLAGKPGHWLKSEEHSPLLAACDLRRPNMVNQFQIVGERAGVHVFVPESGNGVGDPVQVARKVLEHAECSLYDMVVIDTAGRLGIDEVLVQQAANIKATTSPDEVLFAVDAMIGQDAVNTAEAFNEGVGFDGVVLIKLGGDARGGAALSIARVTGEPIMSASNGEGLADLDVFHPDRMASRILGMGDVFTLIERAEKNLDAEPSRKMVEELSAGKGSFGLQDFLVQMRQLRRPGPLSKIFGMLPGAGQLKGVISSIGEREVGRIEAIISSMTPVERDDVGILNDSRRVRTAKGAGMQVSDVNNLVNRFVEARKMMEQMAGGKMPGTPSIGGGYAVRKQQGKSQRRGQKISGNPAKRKQQEAERARGIKPGAAQAIPQTINDFQLPSGLQKMSDGQQRK